MRTRSSSLLSPAAVKWAAAAEDGLAETGAVAEAGGGLGAGRAAGLGVCAAAEAARGAIRQRASTRMAYLLSWGGGARAEPGGVQDTTPRHNHLLHCEGLRGFSTWGE